MNSKRGRTLKIAIGSIVLITAVCGTAAALGWHKYRAITAASQQPPPPEAPEAVSIAKSTPLTYRATVTAVGTVRAPRSITLRNEIAGQVVRVPLQAGQIVEEGQTLLELDRTVEEALLRSGQARQRMAKSMLERTRRIAQANASSGNEVDQAEAEMAQAEAEVARLQAIIGKKTLVAPFRAKAGLLDTHVGQYLSEGTEITTLQSIEDHLLVDFMMPQQVADAVQVGQQLLLRTSAETLSGELIALDAIADRSTRNLMGRGKLMSPPGYLQPNDSVKVEIEYGPELHAIAVPAEALRRSPSGAFVYVMQPDQQGAPRAIVKMVKPGQTQAGKVIIQAGLDLDESIIVDGSFKLREGMLVSTEHAYPMTTVTAASKPASR